MSDLMLVTGATGSTGKAAVRELRQAGARVRAFVHRDDARADALRDLGAEVMVGDLLDLAAVRAATRGVTAAYFVYPIRSGLVDATAYFAQAASEAGVKFIVNMSQISARSDAKSNAARQHWVCERMLDRSGIPVVHLRPTFFAQWLLYFGRGSRIASTGQIVLPFGEGRHAPIAGEDQGRLIAAILRDPAPHAGKTYPLYGSTEMNHHEIAAQVSTVLGKQISYTAQSIPDFKAQLESLHAPQHLVQHLCEVAQDYQDGIFAGTNDIIERVTGRPPLTVPEFVELHRAEFSA
ncbi:MAG: NmrA family NAD(P)-binding protein [Candidatus Afipia apatlaquensis]|uniref:NmrA family NAD(P)-binding protein n=1 Tax=Candidatus Afipia apatlaquensis TaxID=2712852 RepID=A0A7C9VKD9_9BRAD|nr:NmrA family NAD(P)-binding protein [Candidatus Afipia apatlaquensis]